LPLSTWTAQPRLRHVNSLCWTGRWQSPAKSPFSKAEYSSPSLHVNSILLGSNPMPGPAPCEASPSDFSKRVTPGLGTGSASESLTSCCSKASRYLKTKTNTSQWTSILRGYWRTRRHLQSTLSTTRSLQTSCTRASSETMHFLTLAWIRRRRGGRRWMWRGRKPLLLDWARMSSVRMV
jgi:hypothetical protein